MQSSTILKAEYFEKGVNYECIIEFSESGYNILNDTIPTHRMEWLNKDKKSVSYLHICEESAEQITEACRNQIIKYFYNHNNDMTPGLGATVTGRYFKGLTHGEAETIGNRGKKAYYNY
jgi:hypothetical protein